MSWGWAVSLGGMSKRVRGRGRKESMAIYKDHYASTVQSAKYSDGITHKAITINEECQTEYGDGHFELIFVWRAHETDRICFVLSLCGQS